MVAAVVPGLKLFTLRGECSTTVLPPLPKCTIKSYIISGFIICMFSLFTGLDGSCLGHFSRFPLHFATPGNFLIFKIFFELQDLLYTLAKFVGKKSQQWNSAL